MTESTLCPRCDAPNAPGSRFCVECATRLEQPAEAVRPTAPTLAAAPEVGPRCGTCGRANPAIARYCVTCGASLTAAPAAGYAPVPALAGAGAPVVQHIYVAAPVELPLVVRALWFFFVGLPLGLVWVLFAWLFNLTLIGLPLGIWMLSMMPQVMTLRQGRPAQPGAVGAGAASVAVRAVYFILIGWWVSLLWLLLAWAFAATVIGLPLAFLMFERSASVMTLADA